MKWLAVDYGDSRTGLAGCDAEETITSPITPQIEEKSMNRIKIVGRFIYRATKSSRSDTKIINFLKNFFFQIFYPFNL